MNSIPPKLTLAISLLLVTGYIVSSVSFGEEKDVESASTSAKPRSDSKKSGSASKTLAKKKAPAKTAATKKQQLEVRKVLKNARDRLMRYRSIRADIKETVTFKDRQFQAVGSYLQGADLQLRLELSMTINQKISGTLFQVCDGRVLWTHTNVGTSQKITRRAVHAILKVAAEEGNLSENLLQAQLGLGGLPALLASLEQNMVLDEVKEEKIEQVEFLVVQGHWSEKFLNLWKKPAPDREKNTKGKTITATSPLPSRVPDRVRIYFEKKTLFPQRILYLKKHPTKKRYKQMVLLDFQNVKFNTQVNNEDFRFITPEGVPQEDDTQRYIEQLRLNQSGRKR